MSLSQVVRRTRNKLAPWENSCSSSGAVLPWLVSMKVLRMWLLATLPALSQSCKKLKSRLMAACSFIEVMVSQSWSWLQREGKQVTKIVRTMQVPWATLWVLLFQQSAGGRGSLCHPHGCWNIQNIPLEQVTSYLNRPDHVVMAWRISRWQTSASHLRAKILAPWILCWCQLRWGCLLKTWVSFTPHFTQCQRFGVFRDLALLIPTGQGKMLLNLVPWALILLS